MHLVRDMLQSAILRLPGDDARREAEILLAHVSGKSRAWLAAHADDAVDGAHVANFDALVERRMAGEPIAYLVGMRGFHSLELDVTPDVLIPRPETELLVELAMARIPPETRSPDAAAKRRNPGKPLRLSPDSAMLHPGYAIADLGTGSGAIALAIAIARPHARIVATDASESALVVARRNAKHNGIENVSFAHGDWCQALDDAKFDLIVSNPPYIAESDSHMGEGDLRFEPRAALASGIDGLDAIRAIVRDARTHLNSGGWLLFEHGFEQGHAVRALLERHGYRDVFTQPDLEGRERVSGGRAAGSA